MKGTDWAMPSEWRPEQERPELKESESAVERSVVGWVMRSNRPDGSSNDQRCEHDRRQHSGADSGNASRVRGRPAGYKGARTLKGHPPGSVPSVLTVRRHS